VNTNTAATGKKMSIHFDVESISFRQYIRERDFTHTGSNTVDIGKDIVAATIVNVCMKAPIFGSSDMSMIYGLMKNTKSRRVLCCVHTLAILSSQFKTRHFLLKEKNLITVLLTAMRSGCEDADRVQFYRYNMYMHTT
jgi:hypothetical protein